MSNLILLLIFSIIMLIVACAVSAHLAAKKHPGRKWHKEGDQWKYEGEQ